MDMLYDSMCRVPLIPIHHMQAHALTIRMIDRYLLLAIDTNIDLWLELIFFIIPENIFTFIS